MKPNQKIIEMIAMIGLHTNYSHFTTGVEAMFFFFLPPRSKMKRVFV